MTLHFAEQETKIFESQVSLADVIYLPTIPTVDAAIEELDQHLREIQLHISCEREVQSINLGINEDELDMTFSKSLSERIDALNRKIGKLKAIRSTINDSMRTAREDKIREDEEREQQYFATVTIT